jgi:hypothetical protein
MEAMPNTERRQQMLELIAGIDQQLADAERLLLGTSHLDDIRKIVERITSLKVAKFDFCSLGGHADRVF